MLAACTLLKVCQPTNPLCGGLSPFCVLISGKQPGAPEQAQRLIREAAALLGTRGAAVLQKYRSAAHATPGLTPLMLCHLGLMSVHYLASMAGYSGL